MVGIVDHLRENARDEGCVPVDTKPDAPLVDGARVPLQHAGQRAQGVVSTEDEREMTHMLGPDFTAELS